MKTEILYGFLDAEEILGLQLDPESEGYENVVDQVAEAHIFFSLQLDPKSEGYENQTFKRFLCFHNTHLVATRPGIRRIRKLVTEMQKYVIVMLCCIAIGMLCIAVGVVKEISPSSAASDMTEHQKMVNSEPVQTWTKIAHENLPMTRSGISMPMLQHPEDFYLLGALIGIGGPLAVLIGRWKSCNDTRN